MTVSVDIKKTPMYDNHVALGAKMVDFHGWIMPIQYKGIIHEHLAVRKNAGIFDVSHMGTIEIKGKDAYAFIQKLIPNNIDKIKPWKAMYSALCNDDGGMIDDLIVYMFSREHFILIVNASNVDNDFEWICMHKLQFEIEIKNMSDDTCLIALQGPKACGIMEKFLNTSLFSLKHFSFGEFTVAGHKMIVARTGYTGEDGFEVLIDKDSGVWLWENLMKFNPEPIGLGARDTLRLEKGFILYGNDADINATPIEAGISWTVDLKKNDFIGKDKLIKNKPRKKLIFMEMVESGIPRQGCSILCGDSEIGTVTSGTYSPSLSKGIAMGYVTKECKEVNIDIRGKLYMAKVK
jgi:aminomethyltransferase